MSDAFTIRAYDEVDETQVVRLWAAVFADDPPWNVPALDIRRKLAVQRDLLLVGLYDGQVVATVMGGFDGHRGLIHRLAVSPEYERRGFAAAMMAEVEKRLEAIGCTKVNLQVRSTNKQVVAFYQRHGYSVEDRVSLSKQLSRPDARSASSRATAKSPRIVVNDRIQLSAIQTTDKRAFVEHLNDRDIYNTTLRIPYPYTGADADRFLAIAAEAAVKTAQPTLFAIRNTEDQLIGVLGFHELCEGHWAEIGYWLAKPFWRQGIMTEVIGRACKFAFSQWKLVRIVAHVFAHNTASVRVLEKNGFEFEGLLRKHHRKDGTFIDSKVYGLVRSSDDAS